MPFINIEKNNKKSIIINNLLLKHSSMKKRIVMYWLGVFGYSMLKYLDNILDYNEYTLVWYDIDNEITHSLDKLRKHIKIFTDFELSDDVEIVHESKDALQNANIIFLAVPSNVILDKFDLFNKYINKRIIIVNLAKALSKNWLPFSIELKNKKASFKYDYVFLSWWMVAEEFFHWYPLWCTIACENADILDYLTIIIQSEQLYVEKNTDILWVEYAWAFKNVWAILAWYLHAQWFPHGTITYYLSRFSGEIKRLVVNHLWWKDRTYSTESQCWWNDFFMSCTWNTRNRQFGELLWKGHDFENALKIMKEKWKNVEWINTLKVIKELLEKQWEYNFMLLRTCIWFLDNTFKLI